MSVIDFIGWGWVTPTDLLTASSTGRDDRGEFIPLRGSNSIEPGDLVIVTLVMYMPSGDTPDLVFTGSGGGWASLGEFHADGIYINSWWSRASGEAVEFNGVSVDIMNFNAGRLSASPPEYSTEGGVVWMHVIRTVADPTLVYQQEAHDDIISWSDSSDDDIIHYLFAKRPNSDTDSFRAPGVNSYGGGMAVGSFEVATTILQDNYTSGGAGPQDLYGVGFIVNGSSVNWDLSLSDDFGGAFGAPDGALIQGIKIGSGGGGGGGGGDDYGEVIICFI